MPTTPETNQVRVITVGPAEHKRLRIICAALDRRMNDYIAQLINEAWDRHQAKYKHDSQEKTK